jgi:hypothetical protein
VQPTPPVPSQQGGSSVPASRRARWGPYPGPYAFPYQGPDRPFPEERGRVRMPVAARLAAGLGLLSLLPLALLLAAAVVLGGFQSDAGPEWWLYPLVTGPLVQLWGAVDLIGARSWQVLAVGCLPGTSLLAWLLVETVGDGGVLGLGWWVLALAGSPITLLLTVLPSVRHWVAARRAPLRARFA